MEAAGEVGRQPFLAMLAGAVPPLAPALDLLRPEDDEDAEDGDGTSKTDGVVAGDRVGLYGGTTNDATCDRDQLLAFLTANPRHAAAWAAVHGLDSDEIDEFLSDLTPVVLRIDTRVTNHGFSDGRATPRQSVLQAGTSVLVDDRGVPRARCACGNPLLPPTDVSEADFRGERWDTFDPGALVRVAPGAVMDHLVILDLDGGGLLRRPSGTAGEDDQVVAEDDDRLEPRPPTIPQPLPTTTTGPSSTTTVDSSPPTTEDDTTTTRRTTTTRPTTTTTPPPPPPPECQDGQDNDGDGFTDGQDPGCADGTEAPRDVVIG